jgi:hypothetical protein
MVMDTARYEDALNSETVANIAAGILRWLDRDGSAEIKARLTEATYTTGYFPLRHELFFRMDATHWLNAAKIATPPEYDADSVAGAVYRAGVREDLFHRAFDEVMRMLKQT